MGESKAWAIAPGMVIHLETKWLVDSGECETNTINPKDDVSGCHFFLIYEIIGEGCFGVPLHHGPGNNRRQLDQELKLGVGNEWNKPSYVYRWQSWKIPASVLREIIKDYRSNLEDRRSYAINDPSVIGQLAAWLKANTNAYHAATTGRV